MDDAFIGGDGFDHFFPVKHSTLFCTQELTSMKTNNRTLSVVLGLARATESLLSMPLPNSLGCVI